MSLTLICGGGDLEQVAGRETIDSGGSVHSPNKGEIMFTHLYDDIFRYT